jgi:hypothetical protein
MGDDTYNLHQNKNRKKQTEKHGNDFDFRYVGFVFHQLSMYPKE